MWRSTRTFEARPFTIVGGHRDLAQVVVRCRCARIINLAHPLARRVGMAAFSPWKAFTPIHQRPVLLGKSAGSFWSAPTWVKNRAHVGSAFGMIHGWVQTQVAVLRASLDHSPVGLTNPWFAHPKGPPHRCMAWILGDLVYRSRARPLWSRHGFDSRPSQIIIRREISHSSSL